MREVQESSQFFIPSSIKLSRPNIKKKQNKSLPHMNKEARCCSMLKMLKMSRTPIVPLHNSKEVEANFYRFVRAELRLNDACEKHRKKNGILPKLAVSVEETGSNTKPTVALQLLSQNEFKLVEMKPVAANSRPNKKDRSRMAQYKLKQPSQILTKSCEMVNSRSQKISKSFDPSMNSRNILKKLSSLSRQAHMRSSSTMLNLKILGATSTSFLLKGRLALIHTNLKKTLKIKFPQVLTN
eukprot:TRINITY_DN15357_c0_g1_i1.p1 TRINITY_DN15357_c0_g1~~TRINITY_DN15357_c0_g1_i1.p1  ORF type:complete len:240 (+),score=43.76 TRINITY_DN15357_c0_g1_i1:107-826(+)